MMIKVKNLKVGDLFFYSDGAECPGGPPLWIKTKDKEDGQRCWAKVIYQAHNEGFRRWSADREYHFESLQEKYVEVL